MNICHAFQDLAASTMDDLDYSFDRDLKLSEETITEKLLLELDRKLSDEGLHMKSWSKKAEGVGTAATCSLPTGADYDIWFRGVSGKGIGVRIQAKRQFLSGRYDSLDGSDQQIRDLRNNCGSMIPIYLFYNSRKFHFKPEATCLHEAEVGVWGCAFAPVDGIAARARPSPKEIQGMRPWHELVSSCKLGDSRRVSSRVFNLPHAVGRCLRTSYGAIDKRSDWSETAPSLDFMPRNDEPEWVRLLERSGDRPSAINNFLAGTDLKGVALIEQTRMGE